MTSNRDPYTAATGRRHRIRAYPAVIHAQLVDRRSRAVRAATPYRIQVGDRVLRGTTDGDGVLFHAGVPIGWFELEVPGEASFVDSFLGSRADPPSRVWLDGGDGSSIDTDAAASEA